MKLSELKDLVLRMEAISGDNDPNVDFWLGRHEIKEVGEKESDHFLQVIPNLTACKTLSNHRVVSKSGNFEVGDFTLPLVKANFYS